MSYKDHAGRRVFLLSQRSFLLLLFRRAWNKKHFGFTAFTKALPRVLYDNANHLTVFAVFPSEASRTVTLVGPERVVAVSSIPARITRTFVLV